MKNLHDIPAEDCVISAIINIGFDALPANAPQIAEAFSPENAIIFKTAQALASEGIPLNHISVQNRLLESGQLEKTAGALSRIISAGYEGSILAYSCSSVSQLFHKRENLTFLNDVHALVEEGKAEQAVALIKKQLPVMEESSAIAREPKIRFFSPRDVRAYTVDASLLLVGNHHITRGDIFVIGGEPGVGKSTAITELAYCGATGREWFGLRVNRRFKTLILQNENGSYRLKQEYGARLASDEIDGSILVSEPPPFGMTLEHPDFLADVRRVITAFKPDVVAFDPWNAAARDDRAKDYLAAFEALKGLLPTDPALKPALGIVAHTRKPNTGEKRNGGTGMMHLLSGSHALSSVPRSVFIMVRGKASDETDNSVVFFNPKTSNGEIVGRTAWLRAPSGFTPLPDFDWAAFDEEEKAKKRRTIEDGDILAVLEEGPMKHAQAVNRLVEITGLGERACQKALSASGNFTHLFETDKEGCIHAR